MPFYALLTTTVAAGMRAPDGSETVPDRDAVELDDWAHRRDEIIKTARTTSRVIANFACCAVFKGPPSLPFIQTSQGFAFATLNLEEALFSRQIGYTRRSFLRGAKLLHAAKKTLTLWL